MLQTIAVFLILAVVLFFVGRALWRMLRPRPQEKSSGCGCSGCSSCGH